MMCVCCDVALRLYVYEMLGLLNLVGRALSLRWCSHRRAVPLLMRLRSTQLMGFSYTIFEALKTTLFDVRLSTVCVCVCVCTSKCSEACIYLV